MKLLKKLNIRDCFVMLLGSAILAFGMYNVHSQSEVTEGGVIGLTLLLFNWFGISPAVSGFILNFACYFWGYKLFGKEFIINSVIAGGAFSFFYAIFERFPPIYPEISKMPLLASIIGAVFVGVGVGLSLRKGGAPGGDDALALCVAHLTPLSIKWVYLISDLTVLLLSLTYIPLERIMYSLLTVVLSGQIIGFIEAFGKRQGRKEE